MPCLPCGRQWINLILSSEASEYNCFLHFKAIFKMFYILFAVLNDDKHKIYLWNKKSGQTLGCFPSLSKWFHWNVKTKKEYLVMQFTESHISWQVCFHYPFWYFEFFRMAFSDKQEPVFPYEKCLKTHWYDTIEKRLKLHFLMEMFCIFNNQSTIVSSRERSKTSTAISNSVYFNEAVWIMLAANLVPCV